MSGSGKRKIYSAVLIILAVSAVLITITSVVPAIKNLTELTPEQKKDTYIDTFNDNYDRFLRISKSVCSRFDDASDYILSANIPLYDTETDDYFLNIETKSEDKKSEKRY